MEHKIFTTIKWLSVMSLGSVWLFKPIEVKAQYYGSSTSQKTIVVDKKLRPIKDNKFYDNIDRSQKVFVEGNFIDFNIVVENTGPKRLDKIEIKDVLPQYLQLVFYPGTYDKNTNVIQWTVVDLGAGTSKQYLIRARINGLPTIEGGKTAMKLVNKVEIRSGEAFDSDTASYYVETKTIPATGNEDLVWQTLVVMTTAVGALGVRKLARGY